MPCPKRFAYAMRARQQLRAGSDAQSKEGSAVSRGALMQGLSLYASAIMGMAPADSGT